MFNIVDFKFAVVVAVKMFRDDNYHLKKIACSISVGGGGKEQSGSTWTKPITNIAAAELISR